MTAHLAYTSLMKPWEKRLRWKRAKRNLIWISLLVFVWLMCSAQAAAASLMERQQAFPHWSGKPSVKVSEGDLVYPQWMAGDWLMESTLVDMVAPLAPEIVTPGFEGNRQFLDQPIPAAIRFISKSVPNGRFLNQPVATSADGDDIQIVSDRAFNGLSLARAYLGDDWVKAVKVDPDNPNRQITFLKDNQQLVSTVTGRKVEVPNPDAFATTEVFQQFFRNPNGPSGDTEGTPMVYLNEVENTTIYHRDSASDFPMTADQMTAIYLSPQDPNYFKAKDQPVALYRYELTFSPQN